METPCEMTIQALNSNGDTIVGNSFTDQATCSTTRSFNGLGGLPDLDNE
jgi:hypothetical protein